MTAHNRWYDKDPVLSRALEQLRQAPDRYQAQIALNIIKIIVEHQMEDDSDVTMEQIDDLVAQDAYRANGTGSRRRWYDVHETLSSAMQLLRDCPDDLQRRVIPSIATMIEETLENIMAEYPC